MNDSAKHGDVILGRYHRLMKEYLAITYRIARYDIEHYEETIGKCKEFYVRKYNDRLYGIIGIPSDSEKNRHHRCVQGFRTMDDLSEFAEKNGIELTECQD